MDIETIIKYLNALIPISITLLGTYIAYQQWQTNERKRKQDLFELRRKYIYAKAMELIHGVPRIAEKMLKDESNYDSIFIQCARYFTEYNFLLKPNDAKKLDNFFKDVIKIVCNISNDGIENFDKNIKTYESRTKEDLKNNLNNILEKYLRIEK